MNSLHETPTQCPYCGESITLLIDTSVETQEYIEDCAVCCRPMVIRVTVGPRGEPCVSALRDDE